MTVSHARKPSVGPIIQRLIVYTFLLVLVALVLYPKRFGFPAFELNPAAGLLEWAFYAIVLSLSASQLSVSTRVVAAGFTVLYRLGLGAASGCAVGWFHGSPMAQTVVELMWSYPMSLMPQVLCAAVVTGPLWVYLMSAPAPRRTEHRPVRSTFVAPAIVPASVKGRSASASRVASSATMAGHEPTLDDAVSYIGDYSGVKLCWIVDREGLPVAVWQRQMYTGDADFWAPISVEMVDFHSRRLSTGGETCYPERVEVRTGQGRLMVESVGDMWLGVLTDPDADELVNVRITRAREMIARYLNVEGGPMVAAGEVQYV